MTSAGVDQLLVRRLQVRLGEFRQDALERRRRTGQPALMGDDAIQHGKALVQRVVTEHESETAEAGKPQLLWEERQDLVEALEARLFGAGSLQQLLEDPDVENIDINGFQNVFVEYANGTTSTHPPVTASDEDLVETVQTLAAHEGLSSRAFDVANPMVNIRLPDGSRLYAVMAVTTAPSVSIRKHRFMRVTLDDLIANATLSPDLADFLGAVVRARKNVMIAGATGAGKTTLLRAMAAEIDPGERIITVERSLELGLHDDHAGHPNVVALEERLPNAEGVGGVGMASLVTASLRMNPSRVLVGEVLGDEVVTMLNAMNQGNDGSLSTIHANSSADVVNRIATYAMQAPRPLPWESSVALVAAGLDFIVFLRRTRSGTSQQRVIESVREVAGIEDGQLLSNELWGRGPDGRAERRSAVQPVCLDDLRDVGWANDQIATVSVNGQLAPRARGWT